jgi:hypothetical protein
MITMPGPGPGLSLDPDPAPAPSLSLDPDPAMDAQRSTSPRMNFSTRSRASSSEYCTGGLFMK